MELTASLEASMEQPAIPTDKAQLPTSRAARVEHLPTWAARWELLATRAALVELLVIPAVMMELPATRVEQLDT